MAIPPDTMSSAQAAIRDLIRFGSRIGQRFETRAEVVGGLVLIGIGSRILISHMTAGPA